MRSIILVLFMIASASNAIAQYGNYSQNVQQQAWMHYQQHQRSIMAQQYQYQMARRQQQINAQQQRMRRAQILQIRKQESMQREQQAAVAKQLQEAKQRLAEHEEKMKSDPVYAANFKKDQEIRWNIFAGIVGVGAAFIVMDSMADQLRSAGFSNRDWDYVTQEEDAKRYTFERFRRERQGDFSMGPVPGF